MNIRKALVAAAVLALPVAAALPASASSLMNVNTSSTINVNGTISSHTTSWDEYCGAQVTISETSDKQGSLGGDLTGLDQHNGLGGNLAVYAQKSQNFAAQASVTFFKGGDTSNTYINGTINQFQSTNSNGITTSFGN